MDRQSTLDIGEYTVFSVHCVLRLNATHLKITNYQT